MTAAGCLPYWSELPALDMLGLNDYYLPRHPPKNFGNGFLGHELGNGLYTLTRNPDIIIFNTGSLPVTLVGEELLNTPKFYHRYIAINLQTFNLEKAIKILYFNRYSQKIDINQTVKRIIIPGFLFKGNNSFIYLNSENKLVSKLKSKHTTSINFDTIIKQKWHVYINGKKIDYITTKQVKNNSTLELQLISKHNNDIDIKEVVLYSYPL